MRQHVPIELNCVYALCCRSMLICKDDKDCAQCNCGAVTIFGGLQNKGRVVYNSARYLEIDSLHLLNLVTFDVMHQNQLKLEYYRALVSA